MNDKLICYYYDFDNLDNFEDLFFFIKYKDLGKKQYNFNKKFDSEYNEIYL